MSAREDRNRRSGGERGEKRGSGYPVSSYYQRKRKKERARKRRILAGSAAALLAVALGALGLNQLLFHPKNAPESESAEASQQEKELKSTVRINDVDITGMQRSEAERSVLEKYRWKMTAQPDLAEEGDEAYVVSDLLKIRLGKLLDEIYGTDGPSRDQYALDGEGLGAEIASEAAAMAALWDRRPKNGAVASYDKENKRFLYTESRTGRSVDPEAAADAIRGAMQAQNYEAELRIKTERLEPELSAEQAKEKYKVIGTFTTQATQNADRNNNLRLACEAIDGKILQVGEEFSFNHTTGNRTLERGYKPAGAYQNGKVVLEPGGGVCQISSTLYNAVIRAGLTPTERHSHTFAPSYVTPGEDATVSYDGYDGPDMKFVNTTASALALRADFHDRTVTISLVGLPVLEEGTTVSLHSVQTEEYDNGGVEYIEDTTMQPGEEKQISGGSMGSRWVTNLVTKKGGKVVADSFFHNSTYKGHSKKIARNTSGVVTATPDPDALLITENTETVPEQASSAAGEAGVVSPAGPGASMSSGSGKGSSAAEASSGRGPGDAPPSETKPLETKPLETKAAETKPAGIKPAETRQTEESRAVSGPGTVPPEESGAHRTETVSPFPGP